MYKLAKIVKLLRLFKWAKKKKEISAKVIAVIRTGAAIDRVVFFVMILVLMCHFIGCLWIFIGRDGFDDPDSINISWISASGFENMQMMDLYATATYFTMQTLTTVGYGDITIVRTDEKIMCIFL